MSYYYRTLYTITEHNPDKADNIIEALSKLGDNKKLSYDTVKGVSENGNPALFFEYDYNAANPLSFGEVLAVIKESNGDICTVDKKEIDLEESQYVEKDDKDEWDELIKDENEEEE